MWPQWQNNNGSGELGPAPPTSEPGVGNCFRSCSTFSCSSSCSYSISHYLLPAPQVDMLAMLHGSTPSYEALGGMFPGQYQWEAGTHQAGLENPFLPPGWKTKPGTHIHQWQAGWETGWSKLDNIKIRPSGCLWRTSENWKAWVHGSTLYCNVMTCTAYCKVSSLQLLWPKSCVTTVAALPRKVGTVSQVCK